MAEPMLGVPVQVVGNLTARFRWLQGDANTCSGVDAG